MHPQPDDIAVIQMVLQGNQPAYAILVSRYQGYVFTIALRYVGQRELAEELAQDVFVKAYRCLAGFKGYSKFSTWLYTIAHTTCLSYKRKKQAETLLPGEDAMQHMAESLATEPQISRLEQQGQKQLIEEAISRLPAAEAEVITLYYLAGQTVEETAAITGLTAANVKVRLFRARQKLKALLDEHHFTTV
ncbi:MAG: RNA polymerase sigma factor [Taibaiella sp.]|nr:RNA polymerase sigma factor [Taibaiella sp.]